MKRKPRHIIKVKMLPLVLMTLGTVLLTIPTTVFMLSVFHLHSGPDLSNENAAVLLLATFGGLVILFGYLSTLFSRRFSVLFWLFSALYNLGLTSVYLYSFVPSITASIGQPLSEHPDWHISLIVLLFLVWMIFMTAGSIYYTYRAFLQRSLKLP